jgi:hypothetical protein
MAGVGGGRVDEPWRWPLFAAEIWVLMDLDNERCQWVTGYVTLFTAAHGGVGLRQVITSKRNG